MVDELIVGQKGQRDGLTGSHQSDGIIGAEERMEAVADWLQQWKETRARIGHALRLCLLAAALGCSRLHYTRAAQQLGVENKQE